MYPSTCAYRYAYYILHNVYIYVQRFTETHRYMHAYLTPNTNVRHTKHTKFIEHPCPISGGREGARTHTCTRIDRWSDCVRGFRSRENLQRRVAAAVQACCPGDRLPCFVSWCDWLVICCANNLIGGWVGLQVWFVTQLVTLVWLFGEVVSQLECP